MKVKKKKRKRIDDNYKKFPNDYIESIEKQFFYI